MEDYGAVDCNSTLIEPHFLAVNLLWCSFSFVSFVICIMATFLSLYRYRFCCKPNTVSTERTEKLLLYLVVFSSLHSFVNLFQWFRLLVQYDKPDTDIGCAIVGFFTQYFGVGVLIITFCIGIHLLLLVCMPKCLYNGLKEEKKKRYRYLDRGYLFTAIVVPLLLVPWPWINSRYGDAGDWCWIEAWDESCNQVIDGFLEQILLWYLWMFLLMAFTAVATAITLGLLCHVYYKKKKDELGQKRLRVICILLIYLALCLLVNVIGLTDRSIQWKESSSPYPLLVVHAMIYPSWGILSAVVVSVVVCFNRKKGNQHHKPKEKSTSTEEGTFQTSYTANEDNEPLTKFEPRHESSVDDEILESQSQNSD